MATMERPPRSPAEAAIGVEPETVIGETLQIGDIGSNDFDSTASSRRRRARGTRSWAGGELVEMSGTWPI